uniref:Uncharacterized protein n=1 Tax=Oryzias melastigma TaxID=30732 RepID=A0A3B3BUE0_ORYME
MAALSDAPQICLLEENKCSLHRCKRNSHSPPPQLATTGLVPRGTAIAGTTPDHLNGFLRPSPPQQQPIMSNKTKSSSVSRKRFRLSKR